MRRRNFLILVLVVIFVPAAICGLVWIVWPRVKLMHADCRYIEEMSHIKYQLLEELHRYYLEHGHYPTEFEHVPMQFLAPDGNTEVFADLNYSSNGNSFELVWKYPEYARKTELVRVIIERGHKGKSMYSQAYVSIGSDSARGIAY